VRGDADALEDISYCSAACCLGTGSSATTQSSLKTIWKKRKRPTTTPSDFSDYDDDSDESEFNGNRGSAASTVSERKLKMVKDKPIAPKQTSEAAVQSSRAAVQASGVTKKRKDRLTKKLSMSPRDPVVGKMVAYSASHEDWMETEVPAPKRKSSNGKKPKTALYESAKGSFLVGRIHNVTLKPGVARTDKKYEVRWTQTGYQTSKHLHRLTLAQVHRGISNYETLAGKRMNKTTFDKLCRVPSGEVMQVVDDLDDYVVLDTSANNMIMEQEYPENLEVIEQLKTLDFQPSRKLRAPGDLFTHDDSTTQTKIKKSKMEFFETASSSFFAYLPLPFWESTVKETNMYAADDHGTKVTLDELIKWLGIMFYMALNPKGEYANYWGEQIETQVFGGDHLGLESVMSLKRYIYIRKNLCFRYAVTPEHLKADPAARIRPLMNALKSTCLLFVDVGRNIAVDESSIACRSKYGRHLIVYNATKPTGKYHFKIYACCCASTWLMTGFRLHCNSDLDQRLLGVKTAEEIRLQKDKNKFSSAVRDIVLEVTESLQGSKRIVNTDNFYSSVILLNTLKNVGLYGRGTVKATSAHFPKAHMLSKQSDEARGSSLQGVCTAAGIVAASWKDGTTVNVISNADPSSMGVVTRLVGQVHNKFPAPACIAEYNKYMQGVDRLDQLRANYSLADGHSFQKWHKKLALAFIDIARVNAYVTKRLRDNYRPSRNPHREFMTELAREMMNGQWRDSVDDGGFFVAGLDATATTVGRKSASTPVTPTTPSTPTIPCEFVLSSEVFPEATRGKRGCKVCKFEGRPATMKTNFCTKHNVCLCSTTNLPAHPLLKDIACPHVDWSCWRKYHEFYLRQGLFNGKGHIMRSSKLHIARRGLNMNDSTVPPPERPQHALTSSTPQAAQTSSPYVSDRESTAFSLPYTSSVEEELISSPRRQAPGPTSDYSDQGMTLSSNDHAQTPSARSMASSDTTSSPPLHARYAPGPTSDYSDQGMTLSSNDHAQTPSARSVASSDPSVAYSPPTLVVTPFDGAAENATMEARTPVTPVQQPFTPSMATVEFVSVGSVISHMSKSMDYGDSKHDSGDDQDYGDDV